MTKYQRLMSAAMAALVLAVALAGAVFAAPIDATDEIATLQTDVVGTLTTNLPAVLTIGFAILAVTAGLAWVFRFARKGARGG